jgi:hypothetical protein
MQNRLLITLFFYLILGLLSTLTTNDLVYGQQFNKFSDVPGGGGSGTTNTAVESSDNTLLYVVGGAVVVGIVVYAMMQEKKEKSTKDSASAILNDVFLEKKFTINDQILKYQSKIPINISVGMQNDIIKKDEKRYFVGVAYNF